ncbi:MAG: PAS domain S-box protein [Candidatus Rokuibacteriota bacterium]
MASIPGGPADQAAAIVESSADAVVATTLDGVITSWNRAAETLFGYSSAEAIHQPIALIVPVERRAQEAAVLHQIGRGASIDHFETVCLTKDGRPIDVSLAVSPIRSPTGEITGAAKVIRNIRDRLRAEEARGRLAAIVDSSDDAIVSKTLDGIVTSWNRGAERLFGYSAAEAIGQSILLIVPADRPREEADVLRRIRGGQSVDHFETVRRRKDGTLIEISLTVSPVRDSLGRIIGASKTARDITDQKRVQREIAARLLESQRVNRAKDEFLAMLGHELRNPLGAISSAVRLLDQFKGPNEAIGRACDVILRQSAHLGRLVDDLLDVGRVVTGKILLDRAAVDLAEVARRTVGTFTAAGKTQAHRLSVETVPVWVYADSVRFEQVIANLLTNALKYTPVGGAIRVTVGPEGAHAHLQVEDTGIGIAPGLLPHIFDLFVQGERGLDRAQGGLGIGLTLVQRLVELHDGAVEAHSAGPGHGSRFTVRLAAVPAPTSAASAKPTSTIATPRRVLVIEDNEDSRDMLRQLLENAGHEVHDAGDGPQGVDAALRLEPDVALIDVGLPELDGYEVARRIRSGTRRDMLLVALTGYGLAEDRERALAAGFDLHLVKPIDFDKLFDVLATRSHSSGPGRRG